MGSEYLDQRDFESGDFAVHVNPGKVKLYLEAYVDVCPVDRWRPPESEPTVWNLVKT